MVMTSSSGYTLCVTGADINGHYKSLVSVGFDTMYGIELKSGYNDCWWNFGGKCTHPSTYRGSHEMPSEFNRNHDSKENCTVTQLGTQLCSNYKKEIL